MEEMLLSCKLERNFGKNIHGKNVITSYTQNNNNLPLLVSTPTTIATTTDKEEIYGRNVIIS